VGRHETSAENISLGTIEPMPIKHYLLHNRVANSQSPIAKSTRERSHKDSIVSMLSERMAK